uniref:Uncharacterized protein n=1 Tax=Anopheles dirus TaxID=7168 RepID=A0A182N1Z2_9DIPT
MAYLDEFPANRFKYVRYCGVYEHPSVWSSLRLWCTVILLFIFVPLQLTYLIENPGSDLMVTCEEIMLMQVCMIVVLKLNLFVSHHEEMYELVRAFQNTQNRVRPHEFRRFVKCNQIHAKLARLYVIGTTIVAILYALNAAVSSLTLSLQHDKLHFVTPMNFPYDYQHPVVFAISFCYNIETMVTTMFVSVTIDTCYSEMANNLAIHFDIVRQRYAQLDLSAGWPFADRELMEVILYHSEVLDLAQKMVRLFQQPVFYLLLLISTILCVLGYEFVMFSNIYKVIQVVVMAGVMVGQAIIYTYNGSVICDRSLNVSEAIYGTNWYDARTSVRKQIYICLMRAQKPIVMKGGFIEASLPTLKKILRSSGSYITMLMSLE